MHKYLVLFILLRFTLQGYAGNIKSNDLEENTVELAASEGTSEEVASD